jgi:hypothetical protein
MHSRIQANRQIRLNSSIPFIPFILAKFLLAQSKRSWTQPKLPAGSREEKNSAWMKGIQGIKKFGSGAGGSMA